MRLNPFNQADPSSRLPGYLQNGTTENIVWQFKLLAVFMVGTFVWEEYKSLQFDVDMLKKKVRSLEKNTPQS